ncbi:hypothetical protein E2C01_021044 [Portunus trituberculatus]|uniref:Uncharacterized protein n=1 Tax=Portunus trituberculatus TaxID=210409 RepID=A0A5B7E3E2_PORTR|nr:hypothetical protein [Portunus trituberculatus]
MPTQGREEMGGDTKEFKRRGTQEYQGRRKNNQHHHHTTTNVITSLSPPYTSVRMKRAHQANKLPSDVSGKEDKPFARVVNPRSVLVKASEPVHFLHWDCRKARVGRGKYE